MNDSASDDGSHMRPEVANTFDDGEGPDTTPISVGAFTYMSGSKRYICADSGCSLGGRVSHLSSSAAGLLLESTHRFGNGIKLP